MDGDSDYDRVEFTPEQVAIIDAFLQNHPEATRTEAERFCLGRKFVREKIEACYTSYKHTVAEHAFADVAVADVLPELRTQKLYIPGSRDKNGAALFVINAGRHVPGEFAPEDTLRLAFYMGEVLTASPRTQQVGVTIVSNMAGMEWATFDADFQKRIVDLFVGSIPARVKHILLYNSPWWVTTMVRIVAPFLKQKMRERIRICTGEDLLAYVDADQLPTDLGGTLRYSHGAFIRQQMALAPAVDALHEGAAMAFRSRRTAPQAAPQLPSPSLASAGPRSTAMLVSEETARALNEERDAVLARLDERIAAIARRIDAKRTAYRPDALDTIRTMRMSTAARLGVDAGSAEAFAPNLARLQRLRVVRQPVGPIEERHGENYDPARLRERIAASMRKEALHGARLDLPDEDGQASPASLRSPLASPEIQAVPQIPVPTTSA